MNISIVMVQLALRDKCRSACSANISSLPRLLTFLVVHILVSLESLSGRIALATRCVAESKYKDLHVCLGERTIHREQKTSGMN